MNLKLDDKFAIVCASTKGLGFAIAKSLLEEGAEVVLCSSKDVNIEWRHGIPQIDCEAINGEEGRISIIAWGWTNLAN